MIFPKNFCRSNLNFKSKISAKTHEREQQNLADQEFKTEIFFFLAEKIYLLKKLKKLKSCLGRTQTRKNTHILPDF